jgi:hypothetical protein
MVWRQILLTALEERRERTRPFLALCKNPANNIATALMPGVAEISGDTVATCVLEVFSALLSKFKPIVRSAQSREWVPLSGIAISIDGTLSNDKISSLKCVALG